MEIYVWRNYVSCNEETMNDKIFDVLACDTKSVSAVENMVDNEWQNGNVEILQPSISDVFDLMENGKIFLEHCGKEE